MPAGACSPPTSGSAGCPRAVTTSSAPIREPPPNWSGRPGWRPPSWRSEVVEIPVLCLPFAGAGASAFRRAQEFPSEIVRICPLQLPGREERFDEPPFTDAGQAVADLLPVALDLVAGSPAVAVFGHSLGAVLAFELAHQLRQLPRPELVRVFVSGSPGPWTRREPRATGLSDEDFLR